MRAINKYIVVSPIHEEVKSQSGLILSSEEASDLRYNRAEVISAGHLVESIATGDEVYYDKHAGHQARLGDNLYTIILERDVVVCM